MEIRELKPEHRRVEVLYPSMSMSESHEMKWPGNEWLSKGALAHELRRQCPAAVAFRRFAYDPDEGRKFFDRGWVWYEGKALPSEDILSGKAEKENPGLHVTATGIQNIRSNRLSRLFWMPGSKKLYAIADEDEVL